MVKLQWPFYSWRCEDCGARRWRWQGFWYNPRDLDSALPFIISAARDLRDDAGVFSRSGLIMTGPEGPINYGRVFANEMFVEEDKVNAQDPG